VMVPPIASAPLALVVKPTVQVADPALDGQKARSSPTQPRRPGQGVTLQPEGCVPTCVVVLGLAANAELVLANSGSEIAAAARIAVQVGDVGLRHLMLSFPSLRRRL